MTEFIQKLILLFISCHVVIIHAEEIKVEVVTKEKSDWKKYITLDRKDAEPPKAEMARTKEMEKNREELINSVKNMSNEKFVTAIHQLQHLSSVEASALVKGQLSPDGSITTRDSLDMMIITDQKEYVLNILESLVILDKQAPEVQIEVKIIELMEGARRELGVNWSGSVVSGDDQLSVGLNNATDIALPPLSQTLGGSTVEALTNHNFDQLSMKISALMQEGKAKVMSEPKLLVANRHTGEFKMVDQIPWMIRQKITIADDTSSSTQRDLNVTTTTRDQGTTSNTATDFPDGGTGFLNSKEFSNNTVDVSTSNDDSNISNADDTITKSSTAKSVDYVWQEVVLETGITLKVTPEIRQSRVISLDLNPVITEMQSQQLNGDRPIISRREIKTQAYVRDGDTLALGGLIYEKSESNTEGVPLLSKIPVLGRLFQTKKKRGVKTELLFLVRTRIVQL